MVFKHIKTYPTNLTNSQWKAMVQIAMSKLMLNRIKK